MTQPTNDDAVSLSAIGRARVEVILGGGVLPVPEPELKAVVKAIRSDEIRRQLGPTGKERVRG